MARVFISYAREDGAVAARVHGWLVADGHEVFLDRDPRDGIGVGEPWEAYVYGRLRWADAMVCVVTMAYLRSPWCSAEIAIFRWERRRLLPLVAERATVHPLLSSLQAADYALDPRRARAALRTALRGVARSCTGARPCRTRGTPSARADVSPVRQPSLG